MCKVSAVHIKHCTNNGTQAHEELDTRYDNSCGGTDFWLQYLTGKSCSVSLFSASYDLMQDVHIATCLTAYTDKYGQTWILVFNEVYHLLINPNQIGMVGIPISDDTFEENQKLGIAHEKSFIPFGTG